MIESFIENKYVVRSYNDIIMSGLDGRAIFRGKGFFPFCGEHYCHTAEMSSVLALLKFRVTSIFKPKTRIPEALWIHTIWANNYYHWFTDALPRLHYLRKIYGESIPVILPSNYNKKFIIETLAALKFTNFQILQKNRYCHFDKVYAIEGLAPMGLIDKSYIKSIRETLRFPNEPEDLIYISRSNASTRKILNETEVINLLREFDVKVYHFENLSWDKQREIASSARMIIGPHGAGLTNIIFMKKGGKVIELKGTVKHNHNDPQLHYQELAAALELQYSRITSSETCQLQSDFFVDLIELRQLLQNSLTGN